MAKQLYMTALPGFEVQLKKAIRLAACLKSQPTVTDTIDRLTQVKEIKWLFCSGYRGSIFGTCETLQDATADMGKAGQSIIDEFSAVKRHIESDRGKN